MLALSSHSISSQYCWVLAKPGILKFNVHGTVWSLGKVIFPLHWKNARKFCNCLWWQKKHLIVEQKRRNRIFSFKDDDRTLRHILIARKTNESSQTAQNTKNHGSLKTSKNEDIENLGKRNLKTKQLCFRYWKDLAFQLSYALSRSCELMENS